MVKVLGLDIGERKTGVAIADTDIPIATPRGLIDTKSHGKMIERIVTLVQEEGIERIIIGLPLNLKGEVAFQAKKVLEFVQNLKRSINIPIEMIDERLTNKASMSKQDDAVAAALILQTWLDRMTKKIEADEE